MALNVRHSKISVYDFFFANKARKTYTNIAISLILIIVLAIFALRPTLLTISSIKDKTKSYKDYNERVEKKITASRNLQDQINFTAADSPNGLKDEILFLGRMFADSKSLKDVYYNIEERAQKNNIVIKSLTPKYNIPASTINDFDSSLDAPSNKFYEVAASLEAKNFSDVELFLNSIEGPKNFPIISRLKTVSITDQITSNKIQIKSKSQQRDIATVVAFTVTIVIYLDQTRV